jgi:ferritin
MKVKSLLTDNMKGWLQKSMASELYASNLYKHIANQLQKIGFFGGQKYYLKESADELTHYQILVDIVNDFGDVIDVPKVDAIKEEIGGLDDALEISYETEMDLLNQYKEFYEMAEDEDCVLGQALLQFLEIQRKAVGEYGDLISRYNLCGKNEAAILEFDEYIGEK